MKNENYLLGAKLTFENANRLFKASEALEITGEFAIANSLLVLAAEEAMKAYIIANTTIYPDLKETSFKKAFEDHKSKLRSIRSIAGFTAMLNAYMTLWIEPMIEIMDKPEKERTKKRKAIFKNLLNWFKNEAKFKETTLSKELKWWENAKTMKEDGFYVRINKDKWFTPTSISKAKFLTSKKYVQTFINQVSAIQEIDLSSEEFLNVKKQFDDLVAEGMESNH